MDQKGPYHGLLKLVINSFGVLEEEISYELRIECIPETFEKEENKRC